MIKEILGESFNLISHAAPLLASALSSPAAGFAAKFALSLISHTFGLSSIDPKDIADAIQNNSNSDLILQSLEQKFGSLLSNMTAIKMPSNVEINVKCVWAN
jgi:hypothetical protein